MSEQNLLFENFSPETLRKRGTAKWTYFDADVIAAWVAEMDFPTAPPVLAAIRDAVERQEFGYPSREGDTGLPEALAGWASSSYGWDVDPQRVHILPDVLRGVELAIEFFSAAGSPVILPTPAYMPFFEVPRVVNRRIVEVPLAVEDGRYSLDLDGIDRAFADGAGVLILCQPYNPLGRAFSRKELEDLSVVVARHGGRVVSDEIHAPLTYEQTHIPYASVNGDAAAHTVTVTSASKAWNLPGLKCAQVITSNDADEEVWRGISMMKTHGASTIGIRANVAAFEEGGAWLAEAMSYLDGNRRLIGELLDQHLPEIGYRMPEATYFAWLDCRPLRLDVEPGEFFLEHARVATSPGPPFGELAKGFVRFNFATSRSILEQAVKAMATAVHAR